MQSKKLRFVDVNIIQFSLITLILILKFYWNIYMHGCVDMHTGEQYFVNRKMHLFFQLKNLLNFCNYGYYVYSAYIRVNLNIYPFDTGFKLLVSCSHLQESYYGPFAYNSAIDSSIRRLHRMIGPWRVFSAAREREAWSHSVRLVNYSLRLSILP